MGCGAPCLYFQSNWIFAQGSDELRLHLKLKDYAVVPTYISIDRQSYLPALNNQSFKKIIVLLKECEEVFQGEPELFVC